MTMKKLSIIFLALMGLLLIGTASAAVMVTIPSGTVGAGAKATIPISVAGASNLGAMDVTISYDPAVLKFSKAELGELSTNGIVEGNEVQPGVAKISFADTKGISGDGTLLLVTFEVVGAKGASTALNAGARAFGLDLKDMPASAQGGTITVSQTAGKSGIETAVIPIAIGIGIIFFAKRRD
jgi:hypothetical protein